MLQAYMLWEKEEKVKFKIQCVRVLAAATLLVSGAQLVAAAPGVTFQDIAAGGGSGLTYSRTPSARLSILEGFQEDGLLNIRVEYPNLPFKTYGAPGVAALDYDNDGDLDLYVTNGPGTPNSLFKNLLEETGTLEFQDVGQSSGAGLSDQDSNGVCFGDVENDGDLDLYVVGLRGNRLLENKGNGTFQDVTAASGAGGQTTTSASCSMGDVNADGLLDIFVSNTFDDFNNRGLAFRTPYSGKQHNQLLINQGGRVFADRSDSSGIKVLAVVPAGAALISWAASLVDIDLDGDLDAVVATDQHNIYQPVGFVRIFKNDGTGQFTDSTVGARLNRQGEWRSVAFGDLDCNGHLDIFSSNIGDYIWNPGFYAPGTWASRWFLGQSNGTFTDPGVGSLVTLPTGWGAAISDYDNDGDSDIVYHGGWEFSVLWDESNPGILLNNQGCSASFTWDRAALASSTDHLRRNVEGVATGDFNNDGFVDIATVASFDVTPETPYQPLFSVPLGSPFDEVAMMAFIARPQAQFEFWAYNEGYSRTRGTVSLEINSGNSNRWAAFDLVGTRGLVDNQVSSGRVNRDGIGAVVRFTPEGGPTTLNPVVGGSSYASQNSLTVQVGLGNATRGTVEVLWPGGVKNRLYDVAASERLVFPEIPCSFDSSMARKDYEKCVKESLKDLRHPHVGILTHQQADRLEQSALRAYDEAH